MIGQDAGLQMCDGPRWRDGKLLFSDLYGKAVYSLDLGGKLTHLLDLASGPSGSVFLSDGSWILASQRDQKLVRVSEDLEVAEYADLSGVAIFDINELVADSHDRIYVGCFGFDIGAGDPFRAAPLMRVDPDRSVTVVAHDLRFPNGMVLNDAEDTLLLAQTEGHNILAFRVDENGDLHDRRVWADLGTVRPDGICLDADGALWIGGLDSCQFLRVADGGAVLDQISTGDDWAIAPMLGGPDRKHLFQLCAKPADVNDLSGAFAARIDVTEVSVPGSGRP